MKDERFIAASVVPSSYQTLVVIPCLNEEEKIADVLWSLIGFAERDGALIVVVDGGSTDRTQEIVSDIATQTPHVALLHNPDKIQSAGINLAVRMFGADATYLIRVDAHCAYPADYCEKLIAEAEATGADSVVVSMIAEGDDLIQSVNAAAQNSRIGNGGSKHRLVSKQGQFVDHGHHALMRMDAFRSVGGYDETFICNEDAELDMRLSKAGYKIWLTAGTVIEYYPRQSLSQLFRQYFSYGRGRAQNFMKHRGLPKLRQAVLLGVVPAILLAFLTPVTWVAAVPLVVWLIACALAGLGISLAEGKPIFALSGASAALMHTAWSLGFWRELVVNAFNGGLRTRRA